MVDIILPVKRHHLSFGRRSLFLSLPLVMVGGLSRYLLVEFSRRGRSDVDPTNLRGGGALGGIVTIRGTVLYDDNQI